MWLDSKDCEESNVEEQTFEENLKIGIVLFW